MISFSHSADEAGRLAALRQYAVLDTLPEQALDELTELAGQICGTPVALISLVDAERQWFKARVGLEATETPREMSFCAHALGQTELLVVEDASLDPRFAANPLVVGEPHFRFYAGAPLVTPAGAVLGTLCVLDRVPRMLTAVQQHTLVVLSRQVMTHLELRRQTSALRTSEAKQRAIFDAEPECVKLIGPDTTLYETNAAGLRLLEADSYEAVVGRTLLPLVVPEDRAAVTEMLATVVRGEQSSVQYRMVSLKGTQRWIEMSGAPFRGEDAEGYMVLGVSHDITERKLAEDKIQRLNQLYAFSSSVHEAIVRITDPLALYERACRIAVERGGLIMAWVGLVGPDRRVLRPVARWGRDEGYLETTEVVITSDEVAGRGPAGEAFRTGAPACCPDIAADTGNFASRDAALARGYRSCAVFPLRLEGEPVGVLAVYGDQAGYFDTEELQLLQALAENISFAVEARERERRRIEAEAETRRTADLLRAVGDGTPDAVFIKDLQGRYLLFNAAAARFVGRPVEEVIGQDDTVLFGPDELREVQESDRRVMETGQAEINEETLTASGQRRILQAMKAPYRDSEGKVIGLIGISRDVSEARRALEALRVSEERFRLLSKATNDAIWDWNIAADELWWNEGFATLFGLRSEDAGAKVESWMARIHPDERDQIVEDFRRTIGGSSEKWQSEYRFLRSDDTYADVLDRGYVIREPGGPAVRMIGGMTDVTERKKLEQQFLRAQRMESIGTLAGGIAHDLNNSLGPVIMSLDLLRMKFTDPASQELISIISSSAQRGADMVRQVLSFARGVEGRRMEVQIRHLLQDVEKIANDTFLKHIRVRTSIPHDLWLVQGDPTQLHQVLLNLCVNARDSMPEGGSLVLSAENLTIDEHYAELSWKHEARPGPYVLIEVEDSGSGMPAEIMEKIFDPFFTTKEPGKGTGLGLSTSLAIVKSHGGFIRVFSELGKGTRFCVHLPAQTEGAHERPREPVSELPRGHGELVLVIDDEATVRQITRQTLEAFGYEVALASDGADGIAVFAARSAEIAVVLTDMMMPVMDGQSTIRVLRKMDPKVRIIAASGLPSEGATASAATYGVEQFLPKPYTAETLLKTLQRVLAAPAR